MFPTLISGYTDEGTAILSLKGNVEELRDAYKEAQQEAYNLLITSGEDSDGNDIIANWKNLSNTNLFSQLTDFGADDVNGSISVTEALEQLKAVTNMTAEEYRNLENTVAVGTHQQISELTDIEKSIGYGSYIGKTLGIDRYVTDEDFANAKAQARALIQTYQAEIDSALNNVQTLANAYLMTNEDYAQFDDQAKTAASLIVNSIDENIASGFEDSVDVGAYVANIVNIIKDNPEARDAMVGLFSLNLDDLQPDETKEIIDQYIDAIVKWIDKDATDEDALEFKIRFGFENIDTIAAAYTQAINRFTDQTSAGFGAAIEDTAEDAVNNIDLAEYFEKNGINTDEEITYWNEVTAAATNSAEAVKMYEAAKAEATDGTASALSISETIDNLNTQLKPTFDSLKSAYQDIFTDDGFTLENVDLSMLESLKSDLDDLNELDNVTIDYTAFEALAKVLTDTDSTEEQVHESFKALATDIVNSINPALSECTEESYQLVQRMLESLGVQNSEEVMLSVLGDSYLEYTAAECGSGGEIGKTN